MKFDKKVSLIVPVYNAAEHIRLCLDSIAAQTYENIEVVLIDDGSTDNSAEIIREYTEKYPNFLYFYQENSGVAAARNTGIEKATGYYLAFSDNDDYLSPDLIYNMVSSDDNYDIIISGYKRVTYSGKTLFCRKLEQKPIAPYVQLACWAKLFRRDFIVDNGIRFIDVKVAEDLYFSALCYDKTDRIKILPNCDYSWMYNDLSVSNDAQKKISVIDGAIETFEIIKNTVSDKNRELLNYFYCRAVIFYLLFACKGAKKQELYSAYDRAFLWLSQNTDKENKYFGLFKSYGEIPSVKYTVSIFRMLQKLRLAKLFLRVFSKI